MVEKSGSTISVSGLLSDAHIELRSRATLDGSFCQFSFFMRRVGGCTRRWLGTQAEPRLCATVISSMPPAAGGPEVPGRGGGGGGHPRPGEIGRAHV